MGRLVESDRISPQTIAAMHLELKEELADVLDMVRHPRGRVVDAASLRTAEELVEAALEVLNAPEERGPAALARETNLGYSVLITAIDLVKSHTDVPRVPRERKDPPD